MEALFSNIPRFERIEEKCVDFLIYNHLFQKTSPGRHTATVLLKDKTTKKKFANLSNEHIEQYLGEE